mgnify:FL=1
MGNELKLYGIKNCDTVKKACKYLGVQSVSYEFVDFRKNPLSAEIIKDWIEAVGWDMLLNKRSTTFRNLPDAQKNNVTVELLIEQPTLIKRPVLVCGLTVIVGFKPEQYSQFIG